MTRMARKRHKVNIAHLPEQKHHIEHKYKNADKAVFHEMQRRRTGWVWSLQGPHHKTTLQPSWMSSNLFLYTLEPFKTPIYRATQCLETQPAPRRSHWRHPSHVTRPT
jgi:hypothetical protein